MMNLSSLRRCVFLIAALAILAPATARAANFSGTWAVSGTLGRPVVGSSAPVCVFRQSGDRISGTCKGPNGIGAASGTVNGRAILWQWHIIATTSIGLSGIATYHGIWGSDDVIRGTWMHSRIPGVTGPFTAQRVR